MFFLKNTTYNRIFIERNIYVNKYITTADLYIQTYGIKKNNYIQAATEQKMIKTLENVLNNDAIKTIYIDSLVTIIKSKRIDLLLNFANIRGIRVYLKRYC
ncbi:hypothetical protein COBT_003211 [Conglomerata obtusa]